MSETKRKMKMKIKLLEKKRKQCGSICKQQHSLVDTHTHKRKHIKMKKKHA